MAEKPIEDARSKSSKAANQKRSQRTAQAKQPIKGVRQGQIERTDKSSCVHEAEKARRSSNKIRLAGSKADALSHQTEASARPIRAIGRIIFGRIIFRRTFFLRFRPSLLMTCRTKEGLVDRVTRAVRDHSCDVPILGFLTESMIRPKKAPR